MSIGNATAGSAKVARAGRSRDAAASKDALLQAAQTLFGEQGFEGTTIREIADVVITRADRRGPGPILQASVRSPETVRIDD